MLSMYGFTMASYISGVSETCSQGVSLLSYVHQSQVYLQLGLSSTSLLCDRLQKTSCVCK